MSGNLQQIGLTYAPVEDRVLLRVKSSGIGGFRFWLTRRFCKMLYKGLDNTASKFSALRSHQEPEVRDAVKTFQAQQAREEANFDDPYEENEDLEFPLGKDPVLLTAFKCELLDGDVTRLILQMQSGKTITMNLERKLLLNLVTLLREIATRAEWDFHAPVQADSARSDIRPPEGTILH